MDKDIAGQPLWIWLVGAGVIVLGYLYIRSRSSSSSQQQPPTGGGAGGGKYASTTTIHETIKDLQSHPKPRKKP